jgi:hypothetical protein
MSLLGDARKQQSYEKRDNWLSKIKHELNELGMGGVWKKGGENNNNAWRGESKSVWIEGQ